MTATRNDLESSPAYTPGVAAPETRPEAPRPLSARLVLFLGAWFGLLTGLGAVGLWALKAYVLDRVTLLTPHIVWTAPVTFLILGVLAAALLAVPARIVPGVLRLHHVVFVLALLGAVCGLLTWGVALHPLAIGMLSVGIAVQLASFAKRRPDAALRLAHRTAPPFVGLVLAMTACLVGGSRAREAWSLAHLPAAPAGAPNVLLIILDTVRADELSLYGYARPTTPELERLAATSTTFDEALSAAPWTLPSHSAIFTGREPHQLSADWDVALDGSAPTIAERLRARGYRTGGFAGNYYYTNSEFGLARGFIHYEDYVVSLGHSLLSTFPGLWLVKRLRATELHNEFWFHRISGRRIAPEVSRSLVGWLGARHDRPWFAFVNFYDAHDPYVAPEPFIRRMESLPRADSLPVKRRDGTRLIDAPLENRRAALRSVDRYDAAIAYLDAQVGALLDDLRARRLLDNTIVIVTADHGEEFGEGGQYWHGKTVRLASLHVPLLIHAPDRVPAGLRVSEPVSLRDLPATIAELTGAPAGPRFPGASLARTWKRPDAERRAPILSSVRLERPGPREASTRFSLFDAGTHYVRSDCGTEHLFETASDPHEQRDIAPAAPERLGRYRATLRDLLHRELTTRPCAPRQVGAR